MIKRARRLKGLSQKQLAYKLSLSQSYISKIENTKIDTISIKNLIELCKTLDICPVATFIFISNCCSKCRFRCCKFQRYKR